LVLQSAGAGAQTGSAGGKIGRWVARRGIGIRLRQQVIQWQDRGRRTCGGDIATGKDVRSATGRKCQDKAAQGADGKAAGGVLRHR
jgi:hypothetical protein